MAQDSTDVAGAFEAPGTILKMLFTTQQLLASMTYEQRRMCELAMDHPARFDWDFIPKPDRSGIPLWQLDRHQRVMVHSLLSAGLSMRGYTQALQIMAMENVLREINGPLLGVIAGDFRNSEADYLTVFGRPGFDDTWSWRFLGHHLSLSYTIVGQRWISVTPCNMGSEPASAGTIAPLQADDDLGFEILNGVTGAQREQVVIHHVAPADYTTRQVARVGKVEYPDHIDLGIPRYRITDEDREALKFEKDRPRGVAAADMPSAVRMRVIDLVERTWGGCPTRSPSDRWLASRPRGWARCTSAGPVAASAALPTTTGSRPARS
jgi:hypothetical protein